MILLIPVLSVALRGTLPQSLVANAGMIAALAIVSAEHHLGWVVSIRVLALWGAMGATICVSVLQLRARLVDEQVDLVREATTDMVTGLTNRRGFVESIAATRGQHQFAVLTIDVDGLKAVNDDFGHDAGDELIRRVAGACAGAARKGDLVARVGGDEFAIFAVGASAADGRLIAARIQDAVSAVTVRGRRARASIGVAAGGAESQLEEVLSASDAAMYADKRQAKSRALQSA
jgi:diguanylate cyclase (GGDEF)-like protein